MRVYCSHSIQGKYGINATLAQMKENCDVAIALADQLRAALPDIEFYVPAEHEDFVGLAYRHGYLTIEQILDVDCKIIDTCDAVIVFVPDGDELQGGREVEYNHAIFQTIPVITYRQASEAIEWLAHQQMTR
jgi:nucleoside 2-deoxyribosyltransferase